MKNLMLKLTPGQFKLTFLSLLCLFTGFHLYAQNIVSQENEQNKLRISYNHHIDLNQLGLHSTDAFDWEIRNENNEVVVNQSFGNIDAYVFSLPGEYTISISNISALQPSECHHSRLPESWAISVSAYDLTFDVQNLSFSKTLTTENLQNSLILDVPVTLTIFSDSSQSIDLNDLKVMVQGVGCQISVSRSQQQLNLTPGQHHLQYTLKGNSIKQSYIMIDFVDQNGAISTYYHPQSL
jgi:hypothetical protein